jgi:hypothetical protein
LNIILVSSATARARTITLDWRHWTLGGFALLGAFVAFALVVNYVTLRNAALLRTVAAGGGARRSARVKPRKKSWCRLT